MLGQWYVKESTGRFSPFLHLIPLVGSNDFGSVVVGALFRVSLLCGCLAVDTRECGVEAGSSGRLALRTAALMQVDLVWCWTYSAGRLLLPSEVVVARVKTVGPLGSSVKAEVLGDLEAFPQEKKELQSFGCLL